MPLGGLLFVSALEQAGNPGLGSVSAITTDSVQSQRFLSGQHNTQLRIVTKACLDSWTKVSFHRARLHSFFYCCVEKWCVGDTSEVTLKAPLYKKC